MRSSLRSLLVAGVLVPVMTGGVAAQGSPARFGLRGGLGLSPDQVVLGAQAELGTWTIARVVPSVDIGLGDNVTTIDFNADFLLRVTVPDASLTLYGGGGPTVAFIDHDNGNSNWNVGVSAVVGGRLPVGGKHAVNLEARFGIGDIPDFRLIAAIIF